ncbi:MAG: tetratricopeptide repeat protein [Endomicrobium sp.]|jgi:tetratricopeptide (TPR) repeat protein|nr:tetratricopeptide repeat protein [Endomicrobium sp.]
MKKFTFVLIFMMSVQSAFAAATPNYNAYKSYLKAVMASKAGALDTAVKEYEKVVSLDFESVAAHKDLMYLYWQSGNNEKAFETAEKIDKLDGSNPKTTNFIATFYLVAGQSDKAKNFLTKTLELDPDNETATIYLAAYYYSDNKLEKSAQYWNRYLQQQPDSAMGYLQLGMVQEKLEMVEDALKSYDKVIELKPEAREAYLSKARIYESTNRIPSAIAEYEKYIEVFPDNLYVLMYLGKCYFENNEYAKAQNIFLKAKKGLRGAEAETCYYWLGIIYEKMGEIGKAAKEFEYLSAKQPDNISVIARLGYYYSLLKQYSKANKQFELASLKEPLNYEVLYLQSLNYTDWAKYDKAIKALEKTINLNPNFDDAYFFLGGAFDKSGKFEDAEKAFLHTLEINPDHARAMNYLGFSYADRNIKLAEAEILLNRAVSLEPQNAAYLDSLGWLYYRQGKFELAKKYIVIAANFTRDALIYEHLGDVYVELGQLNDALIAYALSCDGGGSKSAQKKLDMVQNKLPENDFYNAVLFRADSNYKKLFSVKAGYKMKISIGGYNALKAYLPFNYVKGEGVNIGVPSKFILGGADIYIKDGNISFEPRAVKDQIPEEFYKILETASDIFRPDFFQQFTNGAVGKKGKKITYAANGFELVLNAENGCVEKITKGGASIELSEYKPFFSSKVPYTIKAVSKEFKFKCVFEAVKVSASDSPVRKSGEKENDDNINIEKENSDENQDSSSGKN